MLFGNDTKFNSVIRKILSKITASFPSRQDVCFYKTNLRHRQATFNQHPLLLAIFWWCFSRFVLITFLPLWKVFFQNMMLTCTVCRNVTREGICKQSFTMACLQRARRIHVLNISTHTDIKTYLTIFRPLSWCSEFRTPMNYLFCVDDCLSELVLYFHVSTVVSYYTCS